MAVAIGFTIDANPPALSIPHGNWFAPSPRFGRNCQTFPFAVERCFGTCEGRIIGIEEGQRKAGDSGSETGREREAGR